MSREINIEYVILIGAGMVAVGNSRGRIESGRSNTGRMVVIRNEVGPDHVQEKQEYYHVAVKLSIFDSGTRVRKSARPIRLLMFP